MVKTKVDKETEYVIAVLAPREKTRYLTIMSSVIKSISMVEEKDGRRKFVFLHDGVTSGSTGYVIETINKIQPSAQQFKEPREITYRKLPLDIEMYGKRSHNHWVDQALLLHPDLLLIIDNGKVPAGDYARRRVAEENISCLVVKTVNE